MKLIHLLVTTALLCAASAEGHAAGPNDQPVLLAQAHASPIRAEVKIRNRHLAAAATVTPISDTRLEVLFDEPQRAVTPGQGAVLYLPSKGSEGDLVVGGGWID